MHLWKRSWFLFSLTLLALPAGCSDPAGDDDADTPAATSTPLPGTTPSPTPTDAPTPTPTDPTSTPTTDADTDHDGVDDAQDSCPNDPNPDQLDSDHDGIGDVCDDDRDGDGAPNDQEAFPDDPGETKDTDGDGVGDNGDAFPEDPAETGDADNDGTGDHADNCPDDADPTQADQDQDGIGDVCDPDRDGDGVANVDDAFPDDSAETKDTDGDGVGDNGDAFPNDPAESGDSDGDGVGDTRDNCPDAANPGQEDLDQDETGDVCDDDRDGDGIDNDLDAFPDNPTEWIDTDGDGVGDNSDSFPNDPTQSGDSDGDGTGDSKDNCPTVPNANQSDIDHDGQGDSCDDDRDGDGVPNGQDAFPDNPKEWADSDGDGVGDNADAFPHDVTESKDSDGDGVGDNHDNCPVDANSDQADLDGDGDGDVCDDDRDGDGVDNDTDAFPDNPVEWVDSDGDGVGDNSDAFPNDPNQSGDQDKDGTGDGLDNCPAVPNADQADKDGDGLGDACDEDLDGDGYGNSTDVFPGDPTEWADSDGDGVGDNGDAFPQDASETTDTDHDGVGDNHDNCPITANSSQADLDADGRGDVCDTDADGDGYTSKASGGKDCNDADAEVRPDAQETCDGIDNNCAGGIDEGVQTTYYRDADGDGYGTLSSSSKACSAPSGYVADSTDCNDLEASINPAATELVGDNVDQNCDKGELCYSDFDGDGYRPDSNAVITSSDSDCKDVGEAAATVPAGDCKDTNDDIHPGATEFCNGIDDDCDKQLDEGVQNVYYQDADGDRFGNGAASIQACSAPSGYVSDGTDCNDADKAVNPGAQEVCDSANVDEDCDGTADNTDSSALASTRTTWYPDADKDGYGDKANSGTALCDDPSSSSAKFLTNHTDCDDANAGVSPAAQEVCDSGNVDEDCDLTADNGDSSALASTKTTWYPDVDKDGYGDKSSSGGPYCDDPSSSSARFSVDHSDCNDANAAIYPGATETQNATDDDCDGLVDEGFVFVSCNALKTAIPASTSGTYSIDPDGSGPNAPFNAYCDMTTSGGGWTLVLRINGADSEQLLYDVWTSATTLGSTSDFSLTTGSDVFYGSYATVGGNELMFYDATTTCGTDKRLLQSGSILGGKSLRKFLIDTTLFNVPYVECNSTTCPSTVPNFPVAAYKNLGCTQPFNPTGGYIFPNSTFGINFGYNGTYGTYYQRFGVQTPDWDSGIGSRTASDDAWNFGDLDVSGDGLNGWSGHLVTVFVR